VSDSTGETVSAIARAALVQFDKPRPTEHLWNLVRSEEQLAYVIERIRHAPGMVLYTLVDRTARERLSATCRELEIPCLPVLDPLIADMSKFYGIEIHASPGRQHTMDADYFARIDAIHFCMAHDDGNGAADLEDADVVLVGASRTSKTPTCIYLANRGVRAANVPLVPGVEPASLAGLRRPLVIGLLINGERLLQIRRERLQSLGQRTDTDYVDAEVVRRELSDARRLFRQRGWVEIDTTRRSIEETAAEILRLLSERGG
jgi:regulator of PEP synthase PpsR (kinase-PPPase family)